MKKFSGNDLMMFVSDLFDEYCNGTETIVFTFIETINDNSVKPCHSYGFRSFVSNCDPNILEKRWRLNNIEEITQEDVLYYTSYVFNFEEVKEG